MSIGENLKAIRESNGLTQEELAKMVYIHRTMISQIERGTKTLTMPLGKDIAEALNCTLDDLAKTDYKQLNNKKIGEELIR